MVLLSVPGGPCCLEADGAQMIYLAITPKGLRDAIQAATPADAIWCGSDAISEEDYDALTTGVNMSRFVYELADRELIDGAVETIEEHHPGQTIWIEAANG